MKSKLHVSNKNLETINLYNQDCKIVKNSSPSSIRNNTVFLRTLADFLGTKTFMDCTEGDMKLFFGTTNYKDDSQEPLKVTIRMFYRWLYKTNDYPPVVKWIKLKTIKQRLEAREIDSIKKKIVSVEEYQMMLSHESHDIQMQAILQTLYRQDYGGCGCRVGELVSMNICDVELGEDYVLISLRKSKTKKHPVPIKPIPELLIRWVDNHPMKSNPDAPLFINFNRDRRVWHKRISTFYVERKFREIVKDLKMKHISPHSFRHTSITIDLANGMPHTHVSTKYGWTKDSGMLRIYDHNDTNELIEYVTGKPLKNPEPSIDILKQQKQRIEKEMNEKQQLSERLETLESGMKALNSTFGKTMLKPTNGYDGEEMIEFPGYNPDEVIQRYNQMKENVSVIISHAVTQGVSQEEIKKYKLFMNKLLS